jgi:hypothetical protein
VVTPPARVLNPCINHLILSSNGDVSTSSASDLRETAEDFREREAAGRLACFKVLFFELRLDLTEAGTFIF